MSGVLRVFLRELSSSALLFPKQGYTVRSRQSSTQKRTLARTRWCRRPDLRLPASRTENEFPLFISHPVYGTLFSQPQLIQKLVLREGCCCNKHLKMWKWLWTRSRVEAVRVVECVVGKAYIAANGQRQTVKKIGLRMMS